MASHFGSRVKELARNLVHGNTATYVREKASPSYRPSRRNADYGKAMNSAIKGAKDIGVGVGGQAPSRMGPYDRAFKSKSK